MHSHRFYKVGFGLPSICLLPFDESLVNLLSVYSKLSLGYLAVTRGLQLQCYVKVAVTRQAGNMNTLREKLLEAKLELKDR